MQPQRSNLWCLCTKPKASSLPEPTRDLRVLPSTAASLLFSPRPAALTTYGGLKLQHFVGVSVESVVPLLEVMLQPGALGSIPVNAVLFHPSAVVGSQENPDMAEVLLSPVSHPLQRALLPVGVVSVGWVGNSGKAGSVSRR